MADTSTAPYSIPDIQPTVVENVELWQTRWSYPAINTDTHASWRLIQPLLVGINQINEGERYNNRDGFGKPVRIELFMGADTFRTRGMVLFDESGRLIVHVVNALLGYGGSGPRLSEQILALLGVTQAMFDEIQTATSQENGTKPYMVIVTYSEAAGWTWESTK